MFHNTYKFRSFSILQTCDQEVACSQTFIWIIKHTFHSVVSFGDIFVYMGPLELNGMFLPW